MSQGWVLKCPCWPWQGEGEEEETDELVSQVLDEIGVDLDTNMVSAPARGNKASQQEAAPEAAGQHAEPMGQSAGGGDSGGGGGGLDDDLQNRLNNLRKP